MHLHVIDIAIIIAYLALSVLIGYWVSHRASRDMKAYFLGGNVLPWYVLGISNASGMFDISGTMLLVYWIFRNVSPSRMDVYFRRLQLVSSAMRRYAHGGNDAQKTAGIITGVLVTAGILPKFAIPTGVIFASYATIALGTLTGWPVLLCLFVVAALQIAIAFLGHNFIHTAEKYTFPVMRS